jgi:transposase
MVALVKMVQRGVHPRTYKEEVEENIKAKPWREQAQYWMSQGLNNVEVAKKVGVHRITVQRFAKQLRDKKWRDGHIRYLNLTEGRQRAAKKKAEECRAIRTAAQRFEDERKKK